MKVKITDEDIKNSAIIFETTEDSWHGVPDKIMCPENVYRKTLAFYYVSKISSPNKKKNYAGSDSSGYRHKAVFVKRPQDPYDERMEKLFKIRPMRRITENDMQQIWTEWNPDM